MLEPWAFAHKRWKKKIAWVLYQQSLMNRAATLHATSAREAENLQRLGLRSKIEVIPWGISTPSCDFNRSASQHSCSSKRTALFVGRIHPIKALAVLVAAWEAVRPSGWRMKLVGPDEGGHQIELEKQVRQAGLEEDFEFVGPMDRAGVQEAYQCADLFILPSHAENFGFVVGEALGFGLPVIASQGVPWEILAKKGAGWWVEGTAKGIGKALREATDCSTERLHFIGAEGRRLVEQRYSWQSVGHSFARLYQKLSRNK
jgi:glycosyltransferase involved in cell wall biosynthesis